MKALVKNFRGISEATIEISPIALLAGHNGAGKTSMARAIAAAVTGEALPWPKVLKKDAGTLLRHGTKAGRVIVGDDQNACEVTWPKAEVATMGNPPQCSPIAAGITDLFSMTPKDALSYMIKALRADPTADDLKSALSALGIPETTAAAVWKVIDAQGWEAAHKRAKETGSQLKGAWTQISGTAYGEKKVVEWFPENWDDNIKDFTALDMETQIKKAKGELEQLIGESAVSQAEVAKLRETVSGEEKWTSEVETCQKEVDRLTKALKEVETELTATPNPDAVKDYDCPHCSKPVNISAVSGSEFMITKAGKVDKVKLKEGRLKYAELCGDQQNKQMLLATEKRKLTAAEGALEGIKNAKGALEGIKDAPQEDMQVEIATARAGIQKLENYLKMINQMADASKIAAQIAVNQQIVDQLDETGLRKKKLSECLDAFTSTFVEPLCIDFGIPVIELDSNMTALMGVTNYQLLSASEQFRVKTVLQLAIAKLEEASIVIIDGADILDAAGRNKLFAMVQNSYLDAVICMTINKQSQVPNLADSDAGHSYWVEGATCKEIVKEEGKAAA